MNAAADGLNIQYAAGTGDSGRQRAALSRERGKDSVGAPCRHVLGPASKTRIQNRHRDLPVLWGKSEGHCQYRRPGCLSEQILDHLNRRAGHRPLASGRTPERHRKVNCRALKNKAYGIRFRRHGRHALPGIGMAPLVPTSARLSFHQRTYPSKRRFRSCPSQLQRNSGSEASSTVD